MPTTPDLGACRVCGRPIRFVHLVNGRRIPVEPDPDPAGRLATDATPAGTAYVNGEFLLPQQAAYGLQRWRPHSDVCRQRKGRRPAPPEALAKIRADIQAAKARFEQEAAQWNG